MHKLTIIFTQVPVQGRRTLRKENGMCVSEWIGLYGLSWSCVEASSSEVSIPICQCIWRHKGQVSSLQQQLYETKKPET